MKKALHIIKQQIKELMHQSESLPEIKALLRLTDEIDNVLEILPDSHQATAPKPSATRTKTAATKSASKPAATKPVSGSNASSQVAPPTAKMPHPTTGKSKKKEPFIDPGDR